MYSTRGHQLVVNEYHDECLRKAKEAEAARDAHSRRGHDPDAAALPGPEKPAPADPNPPHSGFVGAAAPAR